MEKWQNVAEAFGLDKLNATKVVGERHGGYSNSNRGN